MAPEPQPQPKQAENQGHKARPAEGKQHEAPRGESRGKGSHGDKGPLAGERGAGKRQESKHSESKREGSHGGKGALESPNRQGHGRGEHAPGHHERGPKGHGDASKPQEGKAKEQDKPIWVKGEVINIVEKMPVNPDRAMAKAMDYINFCEKLAAGKPIAKGETAFPQGQLTAGESKWIHENQPGLYQQMVDARGDVVSKFKADFEKQQAESRQRFGAMMGPVGDVAEVLGWATLVAASAGMTLTIGAGLGGGTAMTLEGGSTASGGGAVAGEGIAANVAGDTINVVGNTMQAGAEELAANVAGDTINVVGNTLSGAGEALAQGGAAATAEQLTAGFGHYFTQQMLLQGTVYANGCVSIDMPTLMRIYDGAAKIFGDPMRLLP